MSNCLRGHEGGKGAAVVTGKHGPQEVVVGGGRSMCRHNTQGRHVLKDLWCM
jgi:hypothetical protein